MRGRIIEVLDRWVKAGPPTAADVAAAAGAPHDEASEATAIGLAIDSIRGTIAATQGRGRMIEEALTDPGWGDLLLATSDRLSRQPRWQTTPSETPSLDPIGAGTYRLDSSSWEVREGLRIALMRGSLVDSAESYGYGRVHSAIGAMVRESCSAGVARIITKAQRNRVSRRAIVQAARRALDTLGVRRLMGFLLHWPNERLSLEDRTAALEEVLEAGIAEAIGYSNHSVDQIAAGGPPVGWVQTRYNPADRSAEFGLIPWARSLGIPVIAHSPFGQSLSSLLELDEDRVIPALAEARKETPAHVVLRWHVARGVVAIPRIIGRSETYNNLRVLRPLPAEDVARINASFGEAALFGRPLGGR